MNEKNKTLIVLGFVGVIILLIGALAISNVLKSKKIYEQFESVFYGEEKTFVYIGRPTCQLCNLLAPSLEEMKERYGFDYLYINMDEMTNGHFNKIMKTLNLTSLGTPYLMIVQDGKVVATPSEENGYIDYDELFAFLQKNDIIDKEATLPLNYIGLEQYEKLLAGSDKSIVVVGQSTCGYCIQAKLLLGQIADEKNIDINYLNINYLSNEEGEKLENSIEYFSQNPRWGTPVMFIVQNGKMVSVLEGYNSKDSYIKFFEEQGVL